MKKRTLSRILAGVLAVLMLFSATTVMGVSAAEAKSWDQPETKVYFDATGWSVKCLSVMIGHSDWSTCYPLSKVTGNIYSATVTQFYGATEWCIVHTESSWSGDVTPASDRIQWAINNTAISTEAISSSKIYTINGEIESDAKVSVYIDVYNSSTGKYEESSACGKVTASGFGFDTLHEKSETHSSSFTTHKLNSTTVKLTAEPNEKYTFEGWYSEANGGKCLSVNTTYSFKLDGSKAVYARFAIKTFTVTFKDHDGTVLGTDVVPYGGTATPPEVPAREGYTHTGWNPSLTNITGNRTVTATYTRNAYTVTLKAGSGGSVSGGGTYVYGNSTTIKAMPNTGYRFVSWTVNSGDAPESLTKNSTTVKVTQNTVITANFEKIDLNLIVEAGEGGTATGSGTYDFNTKVSVIAVPNAGYEFYRWGIVKGNNPAALTSASTSVVLTQDTTIRAIFQLKTYTVTFRDWDGTVIKTESVAHGKAATPPAAPTRATSGGYAYTFKGWSADISNVTGNLTVTAQYAATLVKYTVKWVVNGSVVSTQTVAHGSNATPPSNLSSYLAQGEELQGWHTGDGQFTSNFKIQKNTTFYASIIDTTVYIGSDFTNWAFVPMTKSGANAEIYTYTVTLEPGMYEFKTLYRDAYYGYDGEFYDITDVWYNTSDSAGNTTLIATGGIYTFSFNRQTKQLLIKYSVPKYTVTFEDWDGSVIKTEEVDYCKYATAPAAPVREGYIFTGWSEEYSYVTKDIVVTALYEIVAEVEGNSITLSGDIGVNFFIDVNDKALENKDAKVIFTYDGNAVEVPVSEGEQTNYGYKYTCNIPAKNMLTEVTCVVDIPEEAASRPFTYTVRQYADVILANPDTYGEKAVALVKAMLNYGAAAQTYFSYNTDALANDSVYMTADDKAVSAKDFSTLSHELTQGERVQYYGTALSLKSEVGIKHYFTLAEGVDADSLVVVVDGAPVHLQQNGDLYMVEIPNIAAHNIYKKYDVQVGDTKLSYCVMDYAAVAQSAGKQNLLNIMYALDEYARDAVAYKG